MPRRRCPPVNGASVPNVYWRARQEGELKEHARYLALPRPEGEEALARPAFLPQTSQAWREARRGVVTTSRLPGLLGYHEPNEGMQKLLHLPRYSVDATKLDGDAEALRADAAPPHGAAVAPYDPKDAAGGQCGNQSTWPHLLVLARAVTLDDDHQLTKPSPSISPQLVPSSGR